MTAVTMENAVDNKALLAAPMDAQSPASATLVAVARKHGVSPFTQMRQMLSLRRGAGRITLPEYYSIGLFDPALTMEDKREFVGTGGSWRVNDWMNPANLTEVRAFITDKVMYTALLHQLGLATTETQAVAAKYRQFGSIPALHSAAAVRAFLTDDAVFPLFVKPCEGSGSVGSASLIGIEDGQVVMGNGQRSDLDDFCTEVLVDYPEGFIFQTALEQHQCLTNVAGSAVGTMRVVTVRDSNQARVLYTVWKVPSPNAMSDNFWQSGSMAAQVDATGKVGQCRIGTGLDGRFVETHPVSGERFDSVQVPYWDEVRELTCKAHMLFPEFGVFGWDIAITQDGPTIIEANINPYHTLWQWPNRRGIRNSDFMPVFKEVATKSQAMMNENVEMFKSRQRAKGRRA